MKTDQGTQLAGIPSNYQPNTAQFFDFIGETVAWRAYEHKVDRDIPFLGQFGDQLRTETGIQFNELDLDLGVFPIHYLYIVPKLPGNGVAVFCRGNHFQFFGMFVS